MVAHPGVDEDVYPYFVLRHMPTVYTRGRIAVPREHRDTDRALTAEGRAAAVEFVARLVEKHHKSCCAVFGPGDAVYCEPDGSRRPNRAGAPVPDGSTRIALAGPGRAPRGRSTASWTECSSRWDRSNAIWAVRTYEPLFERLRELGVPRSTSFGGGPGGGGGIDVTAWSFLDGGIHDASRDGFVSGGLSGTKVLGERAFVWCCDVLGVTPPRTCSTFDQEELDAQLHDQLQRPEVLEARRQLLTRARDPERLRGIAAELAALA